MNGTHLWCYRREDDSVRADASVRRVLRHVRFTDGGEPQQPQHAVGNGLQNVDPHVEARRIDLVELVEVTVDDGVLRQTVLQPRTHYDRLLDVFTRRCLRVRLQQLSYLVSHTNYSSPVNLLLHYTIMYDRQTCNSLPIKLRQPDLSLEQFRRLLKTHLFS